MVDKKGLGRGLSALLGEDKEVSSAIAGTESQTEENIIKSTTSSIKEVLLSDLEVSPLQPRVTFDEESLKGLVESIKEKGILQPLLVRAKENGKYEIIAGERRFRGSTEAGIEKVPVIIRDFTDQEVLEVALIENLQRENLNAIEEAYGYKKLLEEFNHTQEELAKVVGKSRSHVANTLRLTALSTKIKDMVIDGQLSAGHARALLSAKEPEKLAKKIVAKNLSVRQAEKLVSEGDEESPKKIQKAVKKMAKSPQSYQKDDDILALEEELESQTGLKVSINFDGSGGELIFFYDNLEQLDSVVQKIYKPQELGPVTEEVEMGISPDNTEEALKITESGEVISASEEIVSEEPEAPIMEEELIDNSISEEIIEENQELDMAAAMEEIAAEPQISEENIEIQTEEISMEEAMENQAIEVVTEENIAPDIPEETV